MNVAAKTRTMAGAQFVMLKKHDLKELCKEIEFHTGSWHDLQADYKKYHDRDMVQSGLRGMYAVWVNYKGKTIFAQTRRMYEDEDKQNDFMFRTILNALSKMAVTYDMLELYEFARWGDVLRGHLAEIGMLKKKEAVE